ncbi:MAG: response regulator [Sphaerochaeta sp.]|nr:response regulator [Sphaerochaeta sp.]
MLILLIMATPALCAASSLIVPKYTSTNSLAFVIGILALGVLLGLLLFTLVLAISTRELMFTYFPVIMGFLLILQTFSTYDRFFISLTYNRVTLITHLLFITFLLFFEDFFILKDRDPKLFRLNRASMWVIAGYTVIFFLCKALFPGTGLLNSTLNVIRELFVFYTNFLFLFTIIRAISWMKTEAILLLIAFIPPAIFTSINALNIFSFMQGHQAFTTFLMQYNQPIGLSLQAVLFSLATGNRYNSIKLEQQRSEAEREKLVTLDAERTRFFLNMSHETRTPLTIILGIVHQLRKKAYGDSLEHADVYLAAIERNSLILLRQVNHMLRLEKTRSLTVENPIALGQTLSVIVQEFLPIAEEKQIQLCYIPEQKDNKLALRIFQEDFESLVMNLLSNALKYTASEGTIRVRVKSDNKGQLLIGVSDSGKGVAREDMQKIFEQFEVVDDTSAFMQTGLGLPLVKHIMKGYGGEVTLESTVGQGSIFTLVFPSTVVEVRQSLPVATSSLAPLYLSDFSSLAPRETEQDTKLPTILVLEDNNDLRSYILSILQPSYRVLGAGSAEQALALLRQQKVNLIISDIMMPTMDGHAFLKEVRLLFKDDPIPLIFLTARDSMEERIDSLKEGAIRYITKPFRAEILMAIIEATLKHDQELVGSRVGKFRQGLESLLCDIEHPKEATSAVSTYQLQTFGSEKGLSSREQEILNLIAEGKSDKTIASELHISVKTVANHNRNIYTKSGVSGRYELLAKVYGKREGKENHPVSGSRR